MMKIQYYFIAACLSLCPIIMAEPNQAQTNPIPTTSMQTQQQPSGVSAQDQGFIMTATSTNMAVIMNSQLALQKSTNPQVQSIATRLLQDHTQANTDLTNIVSGLGGALPQAPDSTQQATYAQLTKLDGPAFDQAYLKHMEQAHQKAILLSKTESNMGLNPQLKNYAVTSLPGLETHLTTLDQQLGITQAKAEETPVTQSGSAAVSGGKKKTEATATRYKNHNEQTHGKKPMGSTSPQGKHEAKALKTSHHGAKKTEKNESSQHKEMGQKQQEKTTKTTERHAMVRGYW